MYNRQFHSSTNSKGRESFSKPSMTEPDNAMSIPEIISRYVRGHGLAVPVLPGTDGQAAREDGQPWDDDPELRFDTDEEYQAYLAAQKQAEQVQEELDKKESSSE